MIWFEFTICAFLLTYFAYNLCKEGIIISERTHIEESVIGMFFLAIATSLPEIVTGGVAISILGKVGLGYGDIVGSVMANLMILFVLDYYSGRGRILLKVSALNRLTAVYVAVVIALVLISIGLRTLTNFVPVFYGIGSESFIIALVYVTYLRVMKQKGSGGHKSIYRAEKESFWSIWAKFGVFLVIVIFLGMWLARIGEKIVLSTNLSQTFTGTLILGVVTSLPEIIVSFAALRAGSIDMAVGNIFGSNLFDVCILPFFDCLTRNPILGMLSPGQIVATVLILLLSLISIAAMFVKRESQSRVNWDTGVIFVVGFMGFVLLYFIK